MCGLRAFLGEGHPLTKQPKGNKQPTFFSPGPLLLDAVESYQELLRSGYMEPSSREAVKLQHTSSQHSKCASPAGFASMPS